MHDIARLGLPLALIACGSAAPPAASPKLQAIQAAQAAADAQNAQVAAQMASLRAAGIMAPAGSAYTQAETEQRRAYTEQVASAQARALEAVRQKDDAPRKAAEAKAAACAANREERWKYAKQMVVARLTAENKLLVNAKAIRASCKLSAIKTGSFQISGGRVDPILRDEVKCGALPSGITKNDAYVLLSRDRDGAVGPSGPILEPEDRSPDDSACAEYDKMAGLDRQAVRFEDSASIDRLAHWKSSPTTPPSPAPSTLPP